MKSAYVVLNKSKNEIIGIFVAQSAKEAEDFAAQSMGYLNHEDATKDPNYAADYVYSEELRSLEPIQIGGWYKAETRDAIEGWVEFAWRDGLPHVIDARLCDR